MEVSTVTMNETQTYFHFSSPSSILTRMMSSSATSITQFFSSQTEIITVQPLIDEKSMHSAIVTQIWWNFTQINNFQSSWRWKHEIHSDSCTVQHFSFINCSFTLHLSVCYYIESNLHSCLNFHWICCVPQNTKKSPTPPTRKKESEEQRRVSEWISKRPKRRNSIKCEKKADKVANLQWKMQSNGIRLAWECIVQVWNSEKSNTNREQTWRTFWI